MSVLQLNLTHAPSPFVRLGRLVVAAVSLFSEAQSMARAAHHKYPFADW